MGFKVDGVMAGGAWSGLTSSTPSQKLDKLDSRLGKPADAGRGKGISFPLSFTIEVRAIGSTNSLSGDGRDRGRTVTPEEAQRSVAAASVTAELAIVGES